MNKVWIVEGGWYHEGFSILYIASTKERAEMWRDKNFEPDQPLPDELYVRVYEVDK